MGIDLPPKNPRAYPDEKGGSLPADPEPDPAPEPEPEPEADYGDDMSRRELRRAIRDYAEGVEIDVDLDEVNIEISDRLTKTAGKAINHGRKRHSKPYTMRFAWKAYQTWGWEEFTSTIRHEMIHIWQYQTGRKGGHGRDFKFKASLLDCSVHCQPFGIDDAPYHLYCTGCDDLIGTRQRRSKAVTNASDYRSKCCKAPVRAEENK